MSAVNFIRTLKRHYGAFIDLMVSPPESHGVKDSAATASPWMTAIAVAVTTMVVNCIAFIFVAMPQMWVRISTDTLPQVATKNVNLQMLNSFMTQETPMYRGQHRRFSELLADFSDIKTDHDALYWDNLISESETNRAAISEDIGRVRSFETIGFDWVRAWAKAQETTDEFELATWQSAQDVAEMRRRPGSDSRNTVHVISQFEKQKLPLLTADAEITAYTKRLNAIAESELGLAETQKDALTTRIDTLTEAVHLTERVLGWLVPLLLLNLGLGWLVRRIQIRATKREELEHKFGI